jgi:membrane protease YdiL (CAAX protease family)
MVLAHAAGEKPSELAMLGAGLGAWGPAIAMLAVTRARPGLKWRTHPLWIVGGLLLTPALHLVATLIEVALGGAPAQWFYPPVRPEHVAALVMFSAGEELGWRGYAHGALAERIGVIWGSLVLGALWTTWHLGMWLGGGLPSASAIAFGFIELMAGSVLIAWMFEQSGRSMWVAFALHAGGHLDNVNRAPEGELRLRALRLGVYVAAAGVAVVALKSARDAQPRAAG